MAQDAINPTIKASTPQSASIPLRADDQEFVIRKKDNRNLPFVAAGVLVFSVLGLIGVSYYMLFIRDGSSKTPKSLEQCTYNDATYHFGETFPSSDGCNNCTCYYPELLVLKWLAIIPHPQIIRLLII